LTSSSGVGAAVAEVCLILAARRRCRCSYASFASIFGTHGINNPKGFKKLSYTMQSKLEWPLVLLLGKAVM